MYKGPGVGKVLVSSRNWIEANKLRRRQTREVGMERRREHRLKSLRICEPFPSTRQPVVQAEAAITRRGCVVETFRGARPPEEEIGHALGVG